jgi:hypothetical protein
MADDEVASAADAKLVFAGADALARRGLAKPAAL